MPRSQEDQARYEDAQRRYRESERVRVFRGRSGDKPVAGAAPDPLQSTGLPEQLPPVTGFALFDRILYGLQGKVYNPNQEGPR